MTNSADIELVIANALEQWRNSLINLSGTNKLLNYRPTKSSTVEFDGDDMTELYAALEAGAYARGLQKAESEDGDVDDPDSLEAQVVAAFHPASGDEFRGKATIQVRREQVLVDRAVRTLRAKSVSDFTERGLSTLYVAFGFLRWVEGNGDARRSPLVLVPVSLTAATSRERPLIVPSDEDVVSNPALALKLDEFGLALPSSESVTEALAERGIEGALSLFDALQLPTGWGIERSAVLATFMFAKEAMYRDLLTNEAKVLAHPGVRALAGGSRASSARDSFGFEPISEAEIDEQAPPEKRPLILDADSSQRAAVEAALQGKSFVLDGPPGTGKSQTIANMIGALIESGKSVLFVSEKAVALDVVKQRLNARGLGSFLFELHSHKATRVAVAQALGEALDSVPKPPKPTPPNVFDEATEYRRRLNDYAIAANQVREPLGESVHDVLGQLAQLADVPAAPTPALAIGDITQTFLRETQGYAGVASKHWVDVGGFDEHPLRGLRRNRSVEHEVEDAVEALAALDSGLAPFEALASLFELSLPKDFNAVENVIAAWDAEGSGPDSSWLDVSRFERIVADLDRARAALDVVEATEQAASDELGVAWRAIDPHAVLSAIPAQLRSAVHRIDGLTIGAIESAAEWWQERARQLDELERRSAGLAARIGLLPPARYADLQAFHAAAEPFLTELPASARWISTEGAAAARAALQAAEMAHDRLSRARQSTRGLFVESATTLDARGLLERAESRKGLFASWSSSARADKRLLAGASAGGVLSPLRDLPKLIELQESIQQARAADELAAHLLTGFYRAAATDWRSTAEAIDAAERVGGSGAIVNVAALAQVTSSSELRDVVRSELLEIGRLRDAYFVARAPEHVLADGADLTAPMHPHAETARNLEQMARDVANELRATGLGDSRVATDRVLSRRKEIDAALVVQAEVLASLDPRLDELQRVPAAERRAALGRLDAKKSWTAKVLSAVEGSAAAGAWSDELIATLRVTSRDTARGREVLDRWHAALRAVAVEFQEPRSREIEGQRDDLDSAAETLDALAVAAPQHDAYHSAQSAIQRLEANGLGDVLSRALTIGLDGEAFPRFVRKAVLDAWISAVQQGDSRLRGMATLSRDDVVSRFRELDRQMVDGASSKIIRSVVARRPNTTFGASATIRHESQKKRKHIPVRDLLARTHEIVQAIQPCFMMSPLAVSQYLPPDIEFDVVIFDEASQVLPGDAVNCIYRGKALITAGDQKQLPPTSFFSTADDDDGDEENLASDFESILDLMKASGRFTSMTLRWHYRSQHEHLIAYSNASFYGHKLVTFAGAIDESPDLGVKYIPVEGVYRRGTSRDNPIEARAVVERILHHFETRPKESLGVVAFSAAQATAVENALDLVRTERPDLDRFFGEDRVDGFFVKSLELVQGDERDVIIFSTGYGPDENGIVYKQFGPLNRKGGHRRLNVAITRARRLVELVSSMSAGDLGDLAAEGARHLKRYLDFAERGPAAMALELGPSGLDVESPFEESVIDAIRALGYDVQPQVGVGSYRIDLGIRHPDKPGRFVLGVECDGAAYHSSRSARDRDRLRHQILEGLGWRLHHIWGPDWYRHRGREEERLAAVIRDAIEGADKPLAPRSVPAPVVVEHDEHDATSEGFAWTSQYEQSEAWPGISGTHLSEMSSAPRLSEFVRQVLDVEAPLHFDDLKQRLRDATFIGRVGHLIEKNLRYAINRLDEYEFDGDFLIHRTDLPQTFRVPKNYETRSVESVHDEEIAFAVRKLVVDARSIEQAEAAQAIARLLNTRMRAASKERFGAIVDGLVESGTVRRTGSMLSPGR